MSTRHLHRIDASIKSASISRAVADTFQQAWLAEQTSATVTRHDLGSEPLPYLTETDAYAPRIPTADRTSKHELAVERSSALLDQLLAADLLLLAVPLYNWSVPASVKTWLDHVLADPRVHSAPLSGRSAIIVSARGGAYGPGTPKAGWDYAEPYLQRVLGDFLGLSITFIKPELTLAASTPAMSHLVDAAAESLRHAHKTATALASEHAHQRSYVA